MGVRTKIYVQNLRVAGLREIESVDMAGSCVKAASILAIRNTVLHVGRDLSQSWAGRAKILQTVKTRERGNCEKICAQRVRRDTKWPLRTKYDLGKGRDES